jgi:Ser/Thr protein kinase RdoA (MazF antagonist)
MTEEHREINDLDRKIVEFAVSFFSLGSFHKITKLAAKGDRKVYLVDSEFGKVVIKASAKDESKEKVSKDIYILRYLEKYHLPVPELLKGKQNFFLTQFDGRIVYVYSFIEGYSPKPSGNYFYNLGVLLAKLHTISIANYPYCSLFTPEFEIPKLLKEFDEKRQLVNVSRFDELKKLLEDFPSFEKLPKGIIHTDPYLTNLVQNNDDLYLIDLDDAGIAPLLIDIGYVVAHGFTTEPRNKNEHAVMVDQVLWHQDWAEEFFKGYQQIRNLTKEEKDLLLDATRFSMIVYIFAWEENGSIANSWFERYDLLETNVPLLVEKI